MTEEEIELSKSDKINEALAFLRDKLCHNEESTKDFGNMLTYVGNHGLEMEVFVGAFDRLNKNSTEAEVLQVLHDRYDAWDL